MTNKGSFLSTNQAINSRDGDFLVSDNQAYYAIMQADGNFCIYPGSGPDDRTGPALWASETNRSPDADYTLVMQGDGNLCIYPGSLPDHVTGEALWASGSYRGPGQYYVLMQDDGNLCVYPGSDADQSDDQGGQGGQGEQGEQALWASGSAQAAPVEADTQQDATPSAQVVRLQVPLVVSHATGVDISNETNLWDNIEHMVSDKLLDLSFDGHSFTPQITTVALQASIQPQDGGQAFDCYCVQQSANINPSNCYIRNESRGHGWYVINYTFNTYPRDFRGNSAQFQLYQHSPDTTQGQTSVTSGVSYNLGGNVGFFGESPTGGANLGVTISNSRSVAIPDVSVLNQSTDDGNNAKWLYNMPVQDVAGAFDNSLHAPVAMSISNFQPTMYMVWLGRTRGTGTTIAFVTEFSVTLEMTTLDWNVVEYTIHHDRKVLTGQFTFEVALPPPPLE